MNKFQELCLAYSKAQSDFGTYEDECHMFAVRFVKELKLFLQIPESQFSLYKITKENEFDIVPPSLINALTLRDDSYWQFGIGLTVCSAPETLPQELILIPLAFKKEEQDKFEIKYGNESTEFVIKPNDPSSFILFFEYMHTRIIHAYHEQLQKFTGQDTQRKLGYK